MTVLGITSRHAPSFFPLRNLQQQNKIVTSAAAAADCCIPRSLVRPFPPFSVSHPVFSFVLSNNKVILHNGREFSSTESSLPEYQPRTTAKNPTTHTNRSHPSLLPPQLINRAALNADMLALALVTARCECWRSGGWLATAECSSQRLFTIPMHSIHVAFPPSSLSFFAPEGEQKRNNNSKEKLASSNTQRLPHGRLLVFTLPHLDLSSAIA